MRPRDRRRAAPAGRSSIALLKFNDSAPYSTERCDAQCGLRYISGALAQVFYRAGRLTMIGCAGKANHKKEIERVVRSKCGRYEPGAPSPIKNPLNTDDSCIECDELRRIRKLYQRERARSVEEFL